MTTPIPNSGMGVLRLLPAYGMIIKNSRGMSACKDLEIGMIKDATHFYYPEQEMKRLADAFSVFCSQYEEK